MLLVVKAVMPQEGCLEATRALCGPGEEPLALQVEGELERNAGRV